MKKQKKQKPYRGTFEPVGLVLVEVGPGEYVKCKPGTESEVESQFHQRELSHLERIARAKGV